MLKRFIPKTNSVIFTWLISYLLILFVPVLVTGISYIQSVSTIENEINNSNHLLLKRIQKQMDGLLNDVQRLSNEIAFNAHINKLQTISGSYEDIMPYDLYETIKELGIYKTSSRSINDFYVYFQNNDTVVSNINGLDSKSFFDIYLSNMEYDYEQWLKLVSGFYKGEFVPLQYKNSRGERVKTVAYIRTIPLINIGKNFANIVITLDERRFSDDISDMEILNKGELVIVDSRDQIIVSSAPIAVLDELKYNKLMDVNGAFHKMIDNKEVIISYITSEVEKWKYIVIVPESVFWEKAQYIQKLMFVSLTLCLFIGAFITIFSLRKNYNPINKLVKILEKHEGLNFDKINNEYSFIEKAIDKVYLEKENIDKILIQQNKALRSAFLTRLLKGREAGLTPLQDTLQLHEIEFASQYFAVMLFYIEDFEKVFPDDSTEMTDAKIMENYKLVQFIITNVVEELVGQNNQGFMTDADEMMACIINFNMENISNAREQITSVAKEAEKFLNEHFNINYMVSASSIHETLSGLPAAYNEALQAMEYKKLLGIEAIVHYQDIEAIPTGDYYYPLEKEQQFINYIKTGDFEKSKDVLDEIFEKNFNQSKRSLEISRCLMFNLISTMIKTINEINSIKQDEFIGRFNPVQKLLKCHNINEMKFEMIQILRTFCQYIVNKNKSRNKEEETQLKNKVFEHVQNHYGDTEMSIASIAELFGVNPVHLSKVFRDQTGEGLLDFINRIRIEKAKQLFKNDYNNLEDLARDVGFNNTKTFTRAFKKYEGVTPGKYKESLDV